jgi:hypothetical protein
MLNDSHEAGAETIVSWLSHGRGFKVHESEAFVKQVMARYFKQTKYKSFQRQVNILLSVFYTPPWMLTEKSYTQSSSSMSPLLFVAAQHVGF